MAKKYTEEELNNCSKEILVTLLLNMQEQMDTMNQNMEHLIELLASSNNKLYGRSTEKLSAIEGQMDLSEFLNEAEYTVGDTEPLEPKAEEVIVVRKKQKGKREADLKDLPVEVINHYLSDDELTEALGSKWKKLPDEVYKRVKYEPAKYTVEEHHVGVYAATDNQTIIKGNRPVSLFRNSIATPSLVSSIIDAKYVYSIPIHRKATEYKSIGLNISTQNMSNWVLKAADEYLYIIYDMLHAALYKYHVLQADETPVKVSKDGRPANSKSYMWVYRTGKNYVPPIILYEYQLDRKANHPEEFLRGFEGVLVCDGYQAYHKLGNENDSIKIAGCWAHARRRFAEAIKAIPSKHKDSIKDTIAHQAITKIADIYNTDNKLQKLSIDERQKERQLKVKPKVDDFFAWAKEIRISGTLPEKSKTTSGIDYCLNQEQYLRYFLEDGAVPLDNNSTEGAIRNFCVGKHNWKLIDTINGAESSAILYSIAETAKANNLNTFRYFEYLLTELPKHQDETDYRFANDLMPWSDKLPEICKVPQS